MKHLSTSSFYIALQCLCALDPAFAQSVVTKEGCFSSSTGLTSIGPWTYQSSGYCQTQCVKQGKAVGALTKGSDCWCGDKLPPQNSKTDDSYCSTKCQGFPGENCGGSSAWTVFLTGTNSSPGYASGGSSSDSNSGSSSSSSSDSSDSSSSSSSSTDDSSATATQKTQASVVTRASTVVITAAGGQTQIQTTVTTATPEAKSKGGSNTVGIAVGVVVGVVVIAAIAGGAFFLLRQRKKKAQEEEYKNNGVMGSYSNLKPSTSSAGSVSDSRLEPSVMMQRRQSDVSIADNQDYSRRILKVTNPDHS